MGKRKILIVMALVLFSFNTRLRSEQANNWNGYLQYRFEDNYINRADFSIRRAKAWFKGTNSIDSLSSWKYKVQSIFSRQDHFDFLLQDVFVAYKYNIFEITGGQFVPDFSLQRKQHDYSIPLVERAAVVNALSPAAETMARDIGMELKADAWNRFTVTLGIFNGNGANNITGKHNLLLVHSGLFKLIKKDDLSFSMGYNLSYRNAKDLRFRKIFNNDSVFNGRDFRFGFEGNIKAGDFEFQSEYIEADLGGRKARGYYFLADYLVDRQNMIAVSVEQYHDLDKNTNDNPWYILGYSHFIDGNNIKLSVDNRIQFDKNKSEALTTVQIQYFFN